MKSKLNLFSVEQAGKRGPRLEHLFLEEIGRLFRMEVQDPELQKILPVSIKVSQDLRSAKILYVLPLDTEEVAPQVFSKRLEKLIPFLRARIAEAVHMKRVPELYFSRDRDAESGMRAQAILEAEKKGETKP